MRQLVVWAFPWALPRLVGLAEASMTEFSKGKNLKICYNGSPQVIHSSRQVQRYSEGTGSFHLGCPVRAPECLLVQAILY
jgi:hypothetical protein